MEDTIESFGEEADRISLFCEQNNIFDRFYLPEDVKSNHTGIGLNLAKLIVEGHHGSVYVYNHAEGGAVFQVILPIYELLKVTY